MPSWRFFDLKDRIIKIKTQEYKDQMIFQAFNAWLRGAGQKKSFKQFLKHLKLDSSSSKSQGEESLSKEDIQRIKERNLANAKKIIEIDRARREKEKTKSEG